jgi:hypothetical protein
MYLLLAHQESSVTLNRSIPETTLSPQVQPHSRLDKDTKDAPSRHASRPTFVTVLLRERERSQKELEKIARILFAPARADVPLALQRSSLCWSFDVHLRALVKASRALLEHLGG